MKLNGRNLVFGMRGDDVRELRRDLVWLNFDIASREIKDGHFDEATRAAVQSFQKQSRLEEDGVVGTRTVEAINKKLAGLRRTVRGNLFTSTGPLGGATVRAFDQDLRKETQLGEATCNAAGYYEINYAFSTLEKVAPNLFVKGFTCGNYETPVVASSVTFAADPEVIINLVAGETAFRGPSDFELLMKDIEPLVAAQQLKIGELVENEKTQDVTFLSNQTRHATDRIVHAILSHRHAEESRPPTGNTGVPPEAFYAWLRQGLPTEPSALLSQDWSVLSSALVEAVKNNIIPPGFETEAKLKATFESLYAWRIRVALQSPPNTKRMTLGSLVKDVLAEPTLQERFISAYSEHSGPIENFWQTLEKDPQLGTHANELKFGVIVANLGQSHPPLLKAIQSTPRLKDLKDLASLNENAWLALITEHGVGTPEHIDDANEPEKARLYARSLADAVEAAAPTEFFVARLNETVFVGRDDLSKFFRANPSFDIKNTRVGEFLKSNPDALNTLEDKRAAVHQLEGLQRLYRLNPRFESTVALNTDNHSAVTISRMGQNVFVTSYGRHFKDVTQAKEMHAKAQHVSAAAIALVADVNPGMNSVGLNAVPANAVPEIPELSTLFGSLDFCSCGDCQSVNSPAAYLVDILSFLKDRKAKLPEPTPEEPTPEPLSVKDLLFARRPDLGEIELTCENTNTALPYVDLVLEVLEDAVAPPPAFVSFELDIDRIADLDRAALSSELEAAFAGKVLDHATIRVRRPGESWIVDDESFSYSVRKQENGKPKLETRGRQTEGPQSERAANPQYTNRVAYETLRNAVFPWSLPFDYDYEQVKAYLAHLGITRAQVMENFIEGDRLDVLQNTALAHAYLGLTSSEASLITSSDPSSPWLLWGFADENSDGLSWLEKIKNLDEFLRRSGLEYTELLYLLETRYVNADQELEIVSVDPNEVDTCEIEKLALRGLSATIASCIVRFVRLWRKLKWSMFDLDRALPPNSDLTDDFLVQLSHLSRLKKWFNLPVQRLLAFWAPIDTTHYTKRDAPGQPVIPSLYDQLFRSRAGINPLDPSFTEDPLELTGPLVDHAEGIAAAVGVSVADVSAMLVNTAIFAAGLNSKLDLPNLSLLYRHFTLMRALRLSVDDYHIVLALVDPAPFTSPTRTVLFVETVSEIKDSGLSFAELDYLLRPQSGTVSSMVLEEPVIVDQLRELGQELEKGAIKESIARKLAETFGFEIRVVSLLEPQWTSLMDPRLAEANRFLLARLADPTLDDPGKEFIRENFEVQFADLIRLHKISAIASHFTIGRELLEWLLSHGEEQGLFDLRNLPIVSTTAGFQKWTSLGNLLALRSTFSRGEQGLLEVLELTQRSPAAEQDEILDKLVEQTSWDRTELDFLVGPSGFDLTFPDDFKNERALLRLQDCFALLKRLGISAQQAQKLSGPDVGPEGAQGVRQAVRAKYDDAQWLKIAKPLRDVLREKQRAALVAYLVINIKVPLKQLQTPHPDLSINDKGPAVRELQQKFNAAGANPPLSINGEFNQATQDALVVFQNRNGITDHSGVGASTWTALDLVRRNLFDLNDLYELFLIDVEMAPCMMTSRIKQAISSVQLFVQRCLMNLEADVVASSDEDDAWDWWKWMKNYRIWEANRKVFLYPENWIEPELRDDKSPLFRELESELMESDLTVETAESAFLSYVEKLDEVSRLGVMGVYHQKENELDILHVFARTQASPRVYYYRQRVNSAYWTPWEKVDLDIEGNHLVPVVWNSRLYLFWPMFMEKSKPATLNVPALATGGNVTDQTEKYWDMNLAWSEYKQGKWTSKKISSGSTSISFSDHKLASLSKVFFHPEIRGNDLVVHQLFDTTGLDRSKLTFSTLGKPDHPIDLGTGGGVFNPDGGLVVDPDPVEPDLIVEEESQSPPDPFNAQTQFFFGSCYLNPQISRYANNTFPVGRNEVLPGTQRARMFFREIEESGLNLRFRIDLNESRPALVRTPETYAVATQGAEASAIRRPFLFQDRSRRYLITPTLPLLLADSFIDPGEVGGLIFTRRVLSGAVTNDFDVSPTVALGTDSQSVPPFILRPNIKYTFHTLYHPYVCSLISILNREGLDQMLRREVQLDPHLFLPGAAVAPLDFQATYQPAADLVAGPYPTEEIDFGFSGSYTSYNWELFFHAPLMIADRLTKNQRFEEATRWFHYIFNPTDTSSEPAPQRYWQTKEFFEKTAEHYQQERLTNLFNLLARADEIRQTVNPSAEEQKDLQSLNDLEASIKTWRDDPFKPHLVARMRTTAYQKTVVMKYIDNLMAWGDQLFRRDTLETLNEATQLYVLAADILGPRPVEVPPRFTPRIQTYNSLEPLLDDFSNALVEIEERIPVETVPSTNIPEQQPPSMLFFCLPKNDKLLGYWDTVGDRLFKLRHCMNIAGVVRQLPLFEPPIDPALLVRGVAAGLDLNSLLNDVTARLPGYRFNVLSQKATELCSELKSLGATLLATLEKRDAEKLSLLRAKHETGLLEMVEQVREKQFEEAKAAVVALQTSRDLAVSRYLHYQALLGVENSPIPAVDQVIPEIGESPMAKISLSSGIRQIPHETAEMTALTEAANSRGKAFAASLVAAHFAPFPESKGAPMGVGAAMLLCRLPSELAMMFGAAAEESTYQAGLSSRNAQYVMRAHEWTLQNNIAAREIMQIDKQILAAEIRTEMADLELRNHRKQMENAHDVEEFMRAKYTNQELFSWMVGQMSGVYFQAYQLAYETAKRTELCFRHELGITKSNFIQFGYWDSLKKGLMAGEKLHHDLKRMEVAYLDANLREFELTKHVSLVSLDPEQFLTLKETGSCEFEIPEWLFDLETPGHFMRRLKLVSLTIPCVTGPYTTIHCKLRLTKNAYRQNTDLAPGYDRLPTNGTSDPDDRFVDNLSVVEGMVTSTAQNDSGLFEPNMRDERYLPFEGAGAISTWKLELPMEFKSFDYRTISDVILHLRYTARDGSDELSNAATESARNLLNEPPVDPITTSPRGLGRLFSLRHEFPSEWHRFVTSPPSANNVNTITVDLAMTRFPYFVQGRDINITKVSVFERTSSVAPPRIDVTPGQSISTLVESARLGNAPGGLAQRTLIRSGEPGPWTFGTNSDPQLVEDVFVVFAYTAS
jgi:peptidoglycan hydrolase-like protein with peptidoglycan-binding domain